MKSIDVECPACCVPAGEPCVTVTGKRMVGHHSHRRKLAAQGYSSLAAKQKAKHEAQGESAGLKYDQGKLRWSLLPWYSVEQVVKVLEFGAQKYAPNSWQSLDNAQQRYFDACIRHLVAWQRGEKKDPESGLNHLAHAACCVMFLLWGDRPQEEAE